MFNILVCLKVYLLKFVDLLFLLMTRVLTYIVSTRTRYAECQNPSQFKGVNSMPVQTCTSPSLYFSGPPQSLWFQLPSATYVVPMFDSCKF